jgi:hypothetical protein
MPRFTTSDAIDRRAYRVTVDATLGKALSFDANMSPEHRTEVLKTGVKTARAWHIKRKAVGGLVLPVAVDVAAIVFGGHYGGALVFSGVVTPKSAAADDALVEAALFDLALFAGERLNAWQILVEYRDRVWDVRQAGVGGES